MDSCEATPPHVESNGQSTRDAMPVTGGRPSRLQFAVVGIGASAGGLEAFTEFFDAMPPESGMAFVLVQHLSPKHESMIAELLQKHTLMSVRQVEDGMAVEPNHVYVIRPGHTMTIRDGHLHLGDSLLKAGHSRPVDDFFRSLAEDQQERAIAIILSGMGSNGSGGAQAIKVVGGLGIAQEPNSAKFPAMPRSMIDANLADYILKPAEMPEVLLRYAGHPYVKDEPPTDLVARTESHHVNDILAILRARTRHDFSGYKRPTIVRRIQRRMSLTQNTAIADYGRVLRQTPAEVQNLADDLLIHVTGFFRDAEVWEALREKVILPMVAEKSDQASIRVWVTACATGEEAYTLAMLLVEAAESVDKQFDIKVFATDMAERALGHARAGIFPGGIESEISAPRLARFFDRDDSMYRVKKQLRELVVFAPQNVLQDPPFSRLDIVTCRNLLIYLEPDVQQRLLALLHFGLREGGVLVLGNSETIGDGEDQLFEAIDKRLRLYRRVGPTRHGSIEFPGRRARNPAADPADADGPVARASLSQATTKALLDLHAPPSVVVDRHGRIVYFHGETHLFLGQPRGEPTRDLLELALDFVRGSIRVALHGAIETGKPAQSKDGIIHVKDAPHRVEVHASPVDQRSLQGYYLVSFVHYPISQTVVQADGDSEDVASHEELRILRDELQSTIEELQTSNEEMKASHEEVTSVNEELQSTNEELETSKEELQSLNEELTTINAQLEAKMDELESISNDLISLFSSSDTAVIFLDRQFRVRRFTPATKPLIELIPADIGRPLADLARRFDDPKLMDAAASVLATLVPEQATITGEGGRWYARRVLPYRTADDRIDGVVITFVDVTDIKNKETALRQSEQRFRALVTASSDTVYRMSPDWTQMWSMAGKEFVPTTERPTDSWLEKYIPAVEQDRVQAAIRIAIDGRQPFELEHRVMRIDGSVGWAFSRAIPVLGPDGAIVEWFGAASDISARREAEAAVRASEEKYHTLFDSIDEGFCIIEVLYGDDGRANDYLFLEANPVFERQSGMSGVVGRRMLDIAPKHEKRWFEIYGQVAETGEPARFEQVAAALGRHFDVYSFRVGMPEQRRVAVLFTDITERRAAEERQAFFLKLADALRPLTDPAAVELEATRVLGEHLGVDRAFYCEVEPDEDHIVIHSNYATAGMSSFVGRMKVSDFGSYWSDGYRAGRTLATADTRNVSGAQAAALEAAGIRACAGVPVRKAGRLVGIVVVHSATPRQWTALEVSLIEATAERTRDAVDRARAEAALRDSESRYATLTANLPHSAAFVVDTDLRYTLAEGEALRDAGFTSDNYIGKTIAEALPPELLVEYEPNYRAALAGKTFRHEHTAHGRSFITHGGPLRDAAGKVYAAMAVSYDITDRKVAELDRSSLLEAEQYARSAAEAANAAKDQFLANASHELRTPLSSMMLWAKLLKDDHDEKTLKDGLQAIEHGARAQQKLIEDLLDSARIASGKMTLELKPIGLAQVVAAAVNTIRPAANAKGVELKTDFGKNIGTVMADADRLQQIVWNLVNNAVKFTPSGGNVEVCLWRKEDSVEIRVADTGIGIAADVLADVFARFKQADVSNTRRHGGLGLGLSISRQLVELHGGTIEVSSDGPGRGAAFSVKLPLPRTRAQAPTRDVADNTLLRGVNVMLIEDDAQIREVVTMLLQRAGATVDAFDRAAPAKKAFLDRPPDILLSDIGLPDTDGQTLIRELRDAEPPGKRVPAVAFTAFDRPQDRARAIECGFDEHVSKSADASRLIQLLRKMSKDQVAAARF